MWGFGVRAYGLCELVHSGPVLVGGDGLFAEEAVGREGACDVGGEEAVPDLVDVALGVELDAPFLCQGEEAFSGVGVGAGDGEVEKRVDGRRAGRPGAGGGGALREHGEHAVDFFEGFSGRRGAQEHGFFIESA